MRAYLRPLVPACLLIAAACAASPGGSHDTMKATFDAGLRAYDAGDYKTAYAIWTTIDGVDLAAMRNVALMLRAGKGVAKDPKAAERKMAEAAEAGLVTAQADLGDMLLKGEADQPDPKAAIPWLALAAQAGHPVAAFELAELYANGDGVARNLDTARSLYKIAAAAGLEEAAKRLAALPPEPPGTAAAPPPTTPELRH